MKSIKYFSVSVDSTPDVSHVDQLTSILRYVLPSGPVERFVTFLEMQGHSGRSWRKTCSVSWQRMTLILLTVAVSSMTHWSARKDATKALIRGYDEINDALEESLRRRAESRHSTRSP